jgi:hypothetical protein
MPSNFNPAIPLANDRLAKSQQDLLLNNGQLDTSFGVDHYPFSDQTSNNGFHNTVTQPLILAVPPSVTPAHPTTGTNAIIYAMQDSTNIGVIQYSKGPIYKGNQPAPTPITELHSPSTPIVLLSGGLTNVLDMTGVFQMVGTLYMMNYGSAPAANSLNISDFLWNGNGGNGFKFLNRTTTSGGAGLIGTSSGTILQIQNTNASPANNVFWTLRMHRINT